MSFLKKIFGSKGSQNENTVSCRKKREIVTLEEGGPLVRVDTNTISHSYAVLSHDDIDLTSTVENLVAELNEHCQPRVWNVQFRTKFVTFSAQGDDEGYPDASSIPIALGELGLSPEHSIVVNTAEVSLDGGQTTTKLLFGFSFLEENPRIIVPYSDACIAK